MNENVTNVSQDTDMDVPGLSEGKEYMFRVKAVNDEGESEPLETDHATVAKDPYGGHDVWLTLLSKMLVLSFVNAGYS